MRIGRKGCGEMLLVAFLTIAARPAFGDPRHESLSFEMTPELFERIIPVLRADNPMAMSSPEAVENLYQNVVELFQLAEAARLDGLHLEPSVKYNLAITLRNALIEHRVERVIRPDDVSESEIRDYYENNRRRYTLPLTLAAHVFDVDEGDRTLSVPWDNHAQISLTDFAEFAPEGIEARHTGSFFYRPDGTDNVLLPGEVVEALAELDQIGQVVGPITSDGRVWYARLAGRREPVEQPFNQVRESIRRDLYMQRWHGAVDDLRNQARGDDLNAVELPDHVLERIMAAGRAVFQASPNLPPSPMGLPVMTDTDQELIP